MPLILIKNISHPVVRSDRTPTSVKRTEHNISHSLPCANRTQCCNILRRRTGSLYMLPAFLKQLFVDFVLLPSSSNPRLLRECGSSWKEDLKNLKNSPKPQTFIISVAQTLSNRYDNGSGGKDRLRRKSRRWHKNAFRPPITFPLTASIRRTLVCIKHNLNQTGAFFFFRVLLRWRHAALVASCQCISRDLDPTPLNKVPTISKWLASAYASSTRKRTLWSCSVCVREREELHHILAQYPFLHLPPTHVACSCVDSAAHNLVYLVPSWLDRPFSFCGE